jgi:4-hydroxybenzoate polyprenyltransferase
MRSLAAGLIVLMRPHQWAKNGFVLVHLAFGHVWHNATLLREIFFAFAAFCLISSSVYIVNDIFDREADRSHARKRRRPIASGAVSPRAGSVTGTLLFIVAVSLGYLASPLVVVILLTYAGLNIAYSLYLKNVVLIDVFMISTGFMLRILAGTWGVGSEPSAWLLLCGFMLTLFLGFCKRRAELVELAGQSPRRTALGSYSSELLDAMLSTTAALSIIAYSLYTMSPQTIENHGTDKLIYTIPFVAYGIFRYMYITFHRGAGIDASRDVFDAHLLVTVVCWLAVTILLIYT